MAARHDGAIRQALAWSAFMALRQHLEDLQYQRDSVLAEIELCRQRKELIVIYGRSDSATDEATAVLWMEVGRLTDRMALLAGQRTALVALIEVQERRLDAVAADLRTRGASRDDLMRAVYGRPVGQVAKAEA